MSRSSLGSRIRYHRELAGMSRAELSKAVGHKNTGNYIANIENEVIFPSVKLLFKISEVLDIEADYFAESYLSALHKNKAVSEETKDILNYLPHLSDENIDLVLRILSDYFESKE